MTVVFAFAFAFDDAVADPDVAVFLCSFHGMSDAWTSAEALSKTYLDPF